MLYLRHGKTTPDEIQMEVVFPRNDPVIVLETYADRMIAKGRLEGELEGERRGRLEGELEGERRGRLEGKVAILHELDFAMDQIAEKLSLSVEQVDDGCSRGGVYRI